MEEFYKDIIKKSIIIILKSISDLIISVNVEYYIKKKKHFI